MEQVLDPGISARREFGWASRAAGWLRRMSRTHGGSEAPLRIEARLSLGPKKSLVLVHCQGRQLLLAVAGDSITPLTELAAARGRKTAKPAASLGRAEAQR